jgi:hypothetical protein
MVFALQAFNVISVERGFSHFKRLMTSPPAILLPIRRARFTAKLRPASFSVRNARDKFIRAAFTDYLNSFSSHAAAFCLRNPNALTASS